MFDLIAEKSRFFRVRRGQSARDIALVLQCPVSGEMFGGRIIRLQDGGLKVYTAKPCDSWDSIAKAYGVTVKALKELNGDMKIYPTCKILVPDT